MRAAEKGDVEMMIEHRLLACWAKLDADSEAPGYHPLLWHMTDVAMVARELWQSVLAPAQRTMLSDALGLGDRLDSAGLWCALLAGLHDLGKACPAFQLQSERARAEVTFRLHRHGLRVPVQHRPSRDLASHGTVTAATLPCILASEFGIPQAAARGLGAVAGGHHGTLPSGLDVQAVTARDAGGSAWKVLRRDLVTALSEILGVTEHRAPDRLTNGGAMALAGLVSVADWVGSNTRFFPYDVSPDTSGYPRKAQRRAGEALDGLGWRLHPPPRGRRSFTQLFPGIPSPNDLQRNAESIASTLEGPGIVIIEAPMGEGKTEAALCLADRWTEVAGLRGFYFALPTQATSNQMFTRIREFLGSSYRGDPVQLQLLHGHASLSAEFEVLRRNGDSLFSPQYRGVEGWSDHLGVTAAEWFTYRKRGLLAPFGVGTIDQALLAGLRTRHVFVRLFGLSGKTVIIDEVHAYDTYMTTLLERVLEWLAALGSPVVILSATLPRGRRSELISAYQRGLGSEAPRGPAEVEYPRISWAAGGSRSGAQPVGVSRRSEKAIQLEMIDGAAESRDGEPFQLAGLLEDALAHGGCAAVICNTVRRAQEIYLSLRLRFPELGDDGHPELDLLHSQYPFHARDEREQRSLARYGRPGDPAVRRPYRGILVATQVIEQSLDLDFDLMISDMAPADLLLQRAGRLHRHQRPCRPPGLKEPRLLLVLPEVSDGVPRFDPGTAAVYDRHVLLRSWLALAGRHCIQVPGDVEQIIEAVYDDGRGPDDLADPLKDAWKETLRDLRAAREREKREAEERWIRSPSYGGQLWRLTEDAREEDAPGFHAAHQALTRLTSPSAPCVLLYGSVDEAWLDAARTQRVAMDHAPSTEAARLMLHHSVNVSDRRVVFDLLQQDPPSNWRGSPLLRHFKAIFLNGAGLAEVGRYGLCLDAETGVQVSARAAGG